MFSTPSWISDPLHCGRLGRNPFTPGVRVDGRVAYCQTHCVLDFLPELSRAGEVVLVSGASDASATDSMRDQLPDNVRRWWATNAVGAGVDPLPIGFVYSQERHDALSQARALPRGDKLVFICHTTCTNHHARSPLEFLFRFDGVTRRGGRSQNDLSPIEFYSALRQHRFVVAPEGTGPDTHRLWEALALGVVPIVKRSPIHRAWDHLPVLWVDEWEEVTEELLHGWPSPDAEQDLPELCWSHWRQRIYAR